MNAKAPSPASIYALHMIVLEGPPTVSNSTIFGPESLRPSSRRLLSALAAVLEALEPNASFPRRLLAR
jgi:hypothetical protein